VIDDETIALRVTVIDLARSADWPWGSARCQNKPPAFALNKVQKSMNEIGPFRIWLAIFALAVTAFVCIAIYLIIRYLMVV
jgi:hypothetical protein